VIDAERQIDRGESPDPSSVGRLKTFGDLTSISATCPTSARRPGRSKAATLDLLKRELGRLKMVEIDRECVIRFGCRRSKQGAGATTTIGISLKVRFEPGDFRSGIDEQTASLRFYRMQSSIGSIRVEVSIQQLAAGNMAKQHRVRIGKVQQSAGSAWANFRKG